MLVVLALVAAEPSTLIKTASLRLSAACTTDECNEAAPSSYRVESSAERRPTLKEQAFHDDGTRCSVVGDKRCTSKGHLLFRSPLSR